MKQRRKIHLQDSLRSFQDISAQAKSQIIVFLNFVLFAYSAPLISELFKMVFISSNQKPKTHNPQILSLPSTQMDPFKTQKILQQCIANYNNYGIKPKLSRMQLTQMVKIVEKEKKRLGLTHPKITLEDVGLQEIKSKENLYNMAADNAIKITKITSNTHNKVTIGLKANKPTQIKLQAGTLLFPDQPLADNTQSLIIRDDLSTTISDTESQLDISTFCFNQELKSPARETFYLGNIKSSNYTHGMNQQEVWGITRKQKQLVKGLEKKYQDEDKVSAATEDSEKKEKK